MTYLVQKSVLAVVILFSCAATAWAQTAKSILGRWKDEANPTMQTEFYAQADGQFYGKLVNHTGNKLKNGFIVFRNITWNEQAKIFNGTLIKPEDGSEFNVTIVLTNDDRFTFRVKKLFMTKTFQFVRIN